MMQRLLASIGIAGLTIVSVSAHAQPAPPLQPTIEAQSSLNAVQRDIAVAELLNELRIAGRRAATLFRDVRVIDPATGSAQAGQSVVVIDSRIAWTGPAGSEPKVAGIKVVNGLGRYLAPGLVDMHIHAGSQAGWLLNLLLGVTAVRDMAGMPWMLRTRDSINAGLMLAPTLYVAGPLINGYPLEGYAVVPGNSADARRLVRQQAACGYDFIKIHNVVSEPIFDAIMDQASAIGMDVVGHVPHNFKVRHAADRGMRTMEHLKGFLDDRTLSTGDTDYAVVTGRSSLWITPTLYTGLQYHRAAEGRAILAKPEMRYVPFDRRMAWQAGLRQPPPTDHAVQLRSQELRRGFVAALRQAGARFLAGSDADGYTYNVMGFALLDELDLLITAGLSPGDAYRAATIEPAAAMRQDREFGRVQKGMRADLILLDANPLVDLATLRRSHGLMVRGIWLTREMRSSALERLAAIQGRRDADVEFTKEAVELAVVSAESLSENGYILDAIQLRDLGEMVRRAGWDHLAVRIARVMAVPTSGPCAESRPNSGLPAP